VRPNGVAIRRRSTFPMTTDPETGLRVGLHVDSWEKLPVHARASRPLRLCVNLGDCDRYFLFVPVTLVRIVRILRLTPETDGVMYSATDTGRAFLHRYPTFPVVRLKIKPGYGYIAPVENLIHD